MKGPKAGPNKKARVPEAAGASITRFFDRAQENQGTSGHVASRDDARQASPGGPADGPVPDLRRGATSIRSVLLQHLPALQDMGPIDSFAMSQEADAMRVVWHDPQAASTQPQARGASNLGRPAAAAAPDGGADELTSIKQRLITAAQQPRDAQRRGSALAAQGAMPPAGEQLLDGLLAGQVQEQAAAAQPGADGAWAAAPQGSCQSGLAPSDSGPGGGNGGAAHRTPATHLRSILKRQGGAGGGSASRGRRTPASCVQFSLGGSGSGRGRGRAAPRLGSSGKKRQAGQKRKALLELLEQVERVVGGGSDQEEAEAEEGEDVDNKENSPAAVEGACCSVGLAAGRAVDMAPSPAGRAAVDGPTGSQQLMPPPGSNGQRGAHQPSACLALQPLGQGAGATKCGGGQSGGEDEEDALMAQLELELLTQVERRHVAARPGQPHRTHQPRHNLPARQPVPPSVAPAAAEARPAQQAAPPPAQHPAAAAAQQQDGSSPPPRQAQQAQQAQQVPAGAADPPRPLPPSPYDRAHAAPAAAPTAAAPQASGGSWDDDEDPAPELLQQFEAAALRQRAQQQAPQAVPPGSGGGGGGGSEAASQPCLPGDRAEVLHEVRQVFNTPQEQVLLLHNRQQGRDVYAHLRPPWSDLPYRVGDTVNLLAPLDWHEGRWHCLLDMERGMLVLHPDVLLSGTRITSSHECPRRSFLDERVAEDGHNDKAVKGTLTHTLIQTALTEGLRTPPQLAAAAQRVVGQAGEALLEVDLSEEAAMECLRAAIPGITRWMHRFLRPAPAPDSLLGAGVDYGSGREVARRVAVGQVLDIEESIWSTKYGVKGMVDVSCTLVLDDPGQARGSGGGGPAALAAAGAPAGRQVSVAPVEIKTGRAHDSHRAQVLLYLLLMEERYGTALDWGMLWYTGQPDPQLVVKRPAELACLLAVRNRLAAAVAHREMPPLAEEKRQCNWCFQRNNCALAFRAEGGAAATADAFVGSGGGRGGQPDKIQAELAAKYEQAAGHMTQEDCEFLSKWEGLVSLEEAHSCARRPEIWAMHGHERQQLGRCVAGLALSHVDEEQLLYSFCRPDGAALDCAFQQGDMLVLSVEGQHVAVARCYLAAATASALTVSVNKALRRGLLLPKGPPPSAGGAAPPLFDPALRWRLDRDDVSSTFTRLRGNLFALFRREHETSRDQQTGRIIVGEETPQSQQAARLRRLVVGLEAPRFAGPDPADAATPLPGLNPEQQAAVQRVLDARDYTLVLGMPGAGKTTTVVAMVRALVKRGQRVLLTSYTNSAVDNILLKLAAEEGEGQGAPFVRLGRQAGVHPALRSWMPGGERYPGRTTRDLARLAETVPVFAATSHGMGHALLRGRLFDVCIVDEAGQMVLPAALGPLLRARSFVLVGDHNQLPPLVASRQAEAGGLGESLFKRLSDAQPGAVVRLAVQYRMAADVQALPNALVYDGALRCGSDDVAQAVLQLPPSAASALACQPGWVQAVLEPQRRVIFLDTAAVQGGREAVAGDAVSNPGEACLLLHLLHAAAAAGLPQGQFAAISPYRSQVALLDRLCRDGGLGGVEVLTVDKCQGRDKEAVLLSLVRSNEEREAGKLLADWRRINVAITRAKCKLVLLGDARTLAALPLFGRLLDLVRLNGWYLALPPDALDGVR